MDVKYKQCPVLITGNGRLSYSVSVCLIQAEHPVLFFTEKIEEVNSGIEGHFFDLSKLPAKSPDHSLLEVKNDPCNTIDYEIGIAITSEDLQEKLSAIKELEKNLSADSIIAINTESIPLSKLQESCKHPERLIGLNWTEPAHTTYFLEVIVNDNTNKLYADHLMELAKTRWNKDPYLVSNDIGIRSKLISVMAREAFYLVENGYASMEDIDRACRNDAGYYLPFSGNFRYMDLMGTYAYGLVMKDLNGELATDTKPPVFIEKIIEQGGLGMVNNKGFYTYDAGDAEKWNELFAKFSYQIQKIINKYPFNYKKKEVVENKSLSI